jgi:ATP-dependent Clp protease ATP-binding subunit ClpA
MSEYQEEYSVSKLVGSAAGYVGYEQAGALTEPLIQNPNQVILLDEIEKANKSVYDLLLQVLDEGKLTDNHGREASFRNAIVLMTSNVGCANAENMSNQLGFVKIKGNENERKYKAVEEAYKKKFSPEFRNRLTNVFYFQPLNDEVLGMIVDKNIRNIRLALFDKNITINLSDNAKKWFINKSSLENAGGRPVERIINTEISEKIADEILFGTLSENGGKVNVDEKDDKIVLNFN